MRANSAGLLPIGGPPISLIRRATSGSARAATAAACSARTTSSGTPAGESSPYQPPAENPGEALLRHGRHIGQHGRPGLARHRQRAQVPAATCGATSTRFSMVKGNSPLITASTAGALPG